MRLLEALPASVSTSISAAEELAALDRGWDDQPPRAEDPIEDAVVRALYFAIKERNWEWCVRIAYELGVREESLSAERQALAQCIDFASERWRRKLRLQRSRTRGAL